MPRLRITLAYEGTQYFGWQIQTGRPIPTIQGTLEKVFERITRKRVVVFGAGRTDAGVHAEGQVCHVDIPSQFIHIDWIRALNANLPHDIRVLAVEQTDEAFHARRNAVKKTYMYTLWTEKEQAVPRLWPYAWSTRTLDKENMLEAASYIIGIRDFASFQNSGTDMRSTVRTLYSLQPEAGRAGAMVCPDNWPVTTWVVEGDGFLRQMVRNIMGLLVWVGLGKIAPVDVPNLIAACDRKNLPSPSAPARGLTLFQVYYE